MQVYQFNMKYPFLIVLLISLKTIFSQNTCFEYLITSKGNQNQMFQDLNLNINLVMMVSYHPSNYYLIELDIDKNSTSSEIDARPTGFRIFFADMNQYIVYSINESLEIMRADFIKKDSIVVHTSHVNLQGIDCTEYIINNNQNLMLYTSNQVESFIHPALRLSGIPLVGGVIKIVKKSSKTLEYNLKGKCKCTTDMASFIEKVKNFKNKPQSLVSIFSL